MDNKYLIFWWSIPCRGIISIIEEISSQNDYQIVLITRTMSESRIAMGWEESPKQVNHIIIDNNFQSYVDYVDFYSEAIHLVNGIYYPSFHYKLCMLLQNRRMPYINLAEGYANLHSGLLGIVKELFWKPLLIHWGRRVSRGSLGLISLSGINEQHTSLFKKMGWEEDVIKGFGYFPKGLRKDSDGIMKTKRLLYSGLLEKYKGVDVLLSALLKIEDFEYELFIIGEGNEKQRLVDMSVTLNNKVKFVDFLPQNLYDEIYSSSSIVIAPGRTEPWGIRINEAILDGKCIVCSDGLGSHTIVTECKAGVVFQSGDVEALANIIRDLLSNESLIIKYQDNANRNAHMISPKNKARVLIELIEELIEKHG